MTTADTLEQAYRESEQKYQYWLDRADAATTDYEAAIYRQFAAAEYQTQLALCSTYNQTIRTPLSEDRTVALSTEYFRLATPTDGGATHVQVRLLDVRTTTGFEYVAVLQACRFDGEFVVTMPYTWPQSRVTVFGPVTRRTVTRTSQARQAFHGGLTNPDSDLGQAIANLTAPFGGVVTGQ